MSSTITHDPNVDINITLDPAPRPQAGFGNSLLITQADNSSISSRVKAYRNVEDVDADWTAEEVSAAETYFAQSPQPDQLLIGKWDEAGNEPIGDALQGIIDEDDAFYGVAVNKRDGTVSDALSTAVESNEKDMIFATQTSLDAVLTTQDDPPLSSTGNDLQNVIGRERTGIFWHADDTEWYDLGQLGATLPYDPDRNNAPWSRDVRAVADTRGGLPTAANIGTQQSPGALRHNYSNIGLPFGPSDYYTLPGINANNRDLAVILTRDWFRTRLQSDISDEIVQASNSGTGIPIGEAGTSRTVGQLRLAKHVKARYKQGVRAGHFLPDQIDVIYPTVTSANVANNVIPLKAEITLAINAKAVTFNFNFTREPVN